MATFRKDRSGDWVVFGTTEEVQVGFVKVEKRDGSVRKVQVGSLGSPFMANGREMIYGYIAPARSKKTSAAPQKEEPLVDIYIEAESNYTESAEVPF